MNNDIFISPEQVALEQHRFIVKVYGWMAAALGITGLVSLYVASSSDIINMVYGNRAVFIGLIIVELLMVGGLAGFVNRLSASAVTAIFILYSIINGVTLSGIFLVYTAASIATTFFITAGIFGVMGAYGYYTKKDLTRFGSLLFMLLIGLVIASLVNMFLKSTSLYWITSYLGVFIFTGLIAYDTQKLKSMYLLSEQGADVERKGAVLGALTLYLDFINLFLMLLRFFGGRRSN